MRESIAGERVFRFITYWILEFLKADKLKTVISHKELDIFKDFDDVIQNSNFTSGNIEYLAHLLYHISKIEKVIIAQTGLYVIYHSGEVDVYYMDTDPILFVYQILHQ